jgi:predicted CXXCH cytochrome family protein
MIRRLTIAWLSAAALLALAAPAAARQNPYRLKDPNQRTLCLACHTDFAEKLKRPFVHTAVKTGDCAGCHDPHVSSHGSLLASEGGQLCATCHGSVIPAGAKSVHQVVAAGQCEKCHDPHAASNAANLVAKGDALCFTCHKDLGDAIAKAKFSHAPVAIGCLTCHEPHGSDTAMHLLKTDVPELCVKCHKPGTPAFVSRHRNYPVAKASCTSCHNPHGSDQPALLLNTVHAPVANGACSQCHLPPDSPTPFATKRSGFELCKGCHDDVVTATMAKPRLHWAVADKTGCVNCHNPHASRYDKLLKADPRSRGRGDVHDLPFAARRQRRAPDRSAVGQRPVHLVPRLLDPLGPSDWREGRRSAEQEPPGGLPQLPQGARHGVQAHAAGGHQPGAVHAMPPAVREMTSMKATTPAVVAVALVLAFLGPAAAQTARFRHAASVYLDDKGAGLNRPEGVACDARGRVVVADTGNDRIVQYTDQDKTVTGGAEIKIPELSEPTRVQINSKGDIYVLDGARRRVVHLSPDGAFREVVAFEGAQDPSAVIAKSVAVDAADNVYVLDVQSARVLVLNAAGHFERALPLPDDAGFISDLAVDAQGRVLLLDSIGRRVYAAPGGGAAFARLGADLAATLAPLPSAIAASRGTIFIVEGTGGSIVTLGQDGSFLARQLAEGRNEGSLDRPSQLCVTDTGRMFIADRDNSRIQVFDVIR